MSTHRFDHTVDHSDDSKPERQPERLRRIEVITGVERRRKWSAGEKLAIVAESLIDGAVVSEVARRHGVSPQQLFGWRARARAEMMATAREAAPSFVPAIADDTVARRSDGHQASKEQPAIEPGESASIEITLGAAVVRVRGGADPRVLTAVLKALRVHS